MNKKMVMNEKQQEMIEYTIQDLVAFLVEDYYVSMEKAMDFLYTSKTFDKLADVETGLYLQGAAYVYELLKGEGITATTLSGENFNGKMKQERVAFFQDRSGDEYRTGDAGHFRSGGGRPSGY